MREAIELVIQHCCICTKPIPGERLQFSANTCSKDCAAIRKKALRARQDQRECRYCRKPSSMEDRKAYQLFRKLQRTRPDLLHPKRWAELLAEGKTLEDFIALIKQEQDEALQESTDARNPRLALVRHNKDLITTAEASDADDEASE